MRFIGCLRSRHGSSSPAPGEEPFDQEPNTHEGNLRPGIARGKPRPRQFARTPRLLLPVPLDADCFSAADEFARAAKAIGLGRVLGTPTAGSAALYE